jgi:hypothetical protein
MEQLDRFAAGKPIPLVVAAYGMQTRAAVPAADTAGKDWLPALQAISQTVSRAEGEPGVAWYIQDNYIPFQLDRVWTLAPDRQWKLNLDLTGADMYAATNREDLVQWLTQTLDAAQLEKAGASGLAWTDLTTDQQTILAAIVRDPVPVRQMKPGDDEGVIRDSPRGTSWLRRSTLRLSVRFGDVVQIGENGESRAAARASGSNVPVPSPATPAETVPGTSIRFRQVVPARLKPGDLNFDAKSLAAPIGIRGVTTLKEAVAQAVRVTHAPLRLSPEFDKMAVFIGDPGLRTGDVLKALTFGMQGAWRKVGGTWLLAWDRIGRGAVTQWQDEAARPLRNELRAAKSKTKQKNWGVLALDHLTPDPDNPRAPTREQMEILAGPGRDDEATGYFYPPTLAFSDLEPRQQEAFRKEFGYSEEMWRYTKFRSLEVALALSAPGVGVTGLSAIGSPIYPGARRDATTTAKSPDWPPKNLPGDGSLSLPQAVRAVSAPMLLRAEWPILIRQMQRKGLNTLYVPALWDGQTLFPSAYFPQPEKLRGHDALAEILAAAAPAKIRVVAVLNTLAWRVPGGSPLHWMREHREWLDVDILGRTRLEWGTPETLPDWSNGEDWVEDPAIFADYVQPGNAAVRAKLMGLVAELRHYPGLDGVALDHWMRLAGGSYDYPAPPLGFAMQERADALAKTGIDPVDIVRLISHDQPIVTFTPELWQPEMSYDVKTPDDFAQTTYDADAALAADMLEALRPAWPGRVELFNPMFSWGRPPSVDTADVTLRRKRPLPKADGVVSSNPAPGVSGQYRWLPAPRPVADPAANEQRFARAAVRMQRLTVTTTDGQKPLAGVVLDFTTAPDLLWPCLRLLTNQG